MAVHSEYTSILAKKYWKSIQYNGIATNTRIGRGIASKVRLRVRHSHQWFRIACHRKMCGQGRGKRRGKRRGWSGWRAGATQKESVGELFIHASACQLSNGCNGGNGWHNEFDGLISGLQYRQRMHAMLFRGTKALPSVLKIIFLSFFTYSQY